MKKILFSVISILVFMNAFSQSATKIALIPQPASLVVNEKQAGFHLTAATLLVVPDNAEVKRSVALFAKQIETPTGYKLKTVTSSKSITKSISFSLSNDASIPDEGYKLKTAASGITLTAKKPAGIFYGIQTLLQLLPADIVSHSKSTLKNWTIPSVTIDDYPRFGWRGLMLDVTRHFFTVAEVKEYIDQMVKYKFNMLHLHLVDDQGWRIEIKSLPKLTEVGAWRVPRVGRFGTFQKPQPGEKATYGGFYTHEDIKELVKYAAEHYINILPEIDVPGHSLAALASYPDLTCTPDNYYVSPGDPFMIWPGGGHHFYGVIDNTLCPANEKVYVFLDKVFTEVAQLFPFAYIHMGGDETARNFWEKNDQIKELMKKENLKNLDEVQSYFVKRVEKIISSKGKKMIGWDEILQGGLAENAAVMSWRGMQGGIDAAKMGHEVVMSPTDFVYIDYMQGDACIEPPVYASLRLKKTYQFEPLPEGVDPKFIKGGQANLWTEQVYNMRHAEYMTWPRAFAVAEALWSKKENRNWNSFVPRVEAQFERFNKAEIKYAPSMYDPIINVSKIDSNTVKVKLETEVAGLSIHYSFDNSFPDNFYPAYKEPITVPNEATAMKMITYRNNKPIGRMMTITVEELRKRAGLK